MANAQTLRAASWCWPVLANDTIESLGRDELVRQVGVRARHARSEWRRQTRTGLRHLQESSAPLYERTQLFRIYEHTTLPGLFRTAEYSMEIMNYWVRFLGLPDDAEAATAARLARQKVLRSGRRRFIVVLAEQTLRTRLGTPQVTDASLVGNAAIRGRSTWMVSFADPQIPAFFTVWVSGLEVLPLKVASPP